MTALPSTRDARRRRVLVLGLPYFGKLVARMLREAGWSAEYAHHPGRDPVGWARLLPRIARAELLYLVSARVDRHAPLDRLLRLRQMPAVIHWTGTDVLVAAEARARRDLSARAVEQPVHWADAPWLVDELATIGIRAAYVPLPIPGLPPVAPPLPDDFRVLLYLPEDTGDREVFDADTLLRLPRELPDAEFVVFPSPAESLPGPLPANLTALPWVDDMDALYRSATAYVRLTKHDGMPFTVIEALARGRHVIYPRELPGVLRAEGHQVVTERLRELHARHQAGELGLNDAGIAFARERFDEHRLRGDLDRRLRELLAAVTTG